MYDAVVIGVSAGGMNALRTILTALPQSFPLPIAIVQHIAPQSDAYLSGYLDKLSAITVKEAEDKELMRPGTAYLAPAGYHLLINPDETFSFSVDPPVNFSCPAIDVLFESAADVFKDKLIGIVLTGASADGSQGLKKIKAQGGILIVQNPETAEVPYMPQAALDAVQVDYIVNLDEISSLLLQLTKPFEGDIHGSNTHR